MEKREWTREMRTISSQFETREDGEGKSIDGYFSVFNSNYDIGPGMSESVAPGAFAHTLSGDVCYLPRSSTSSRWL